MTPFLQLTNKLEAQYLNMGTINKKEHHSVTTVT